MTIAKVKSKAVISFALALATASVFTLSAFAASNTGGAATESRPVVRVENNSPTGRLTGTGRFTIDGDQAQNGAAVLNGSTVATGDASSATIDLGLAGRIELRSNTTITLSLSPNAVGIRVASERARLSVLSGQVEVKSTASARTLKAGEEASFDGAIEASAASGSVLAVESGADSNKKTAAPTSSFISAGAAGVITLVGLATAITLGVMAGSNDEETQQLPRPSTVVP